MKRPYVICHMLSSLDGKINGPFMQSSVAAGMSRAYGEIRDRMNGTVTTREFTNFEDPELDVTGTVSEGDKQRISLAVRKDAAVRG